MSVAVRGISTRRQIAKDANAVVRAARETRASLAALLKLVSRTRREASTITDQGIETLGWIQSSERERLDDFYMAMKEQIASQERAA